MKPTIDERIEASIRNALFAIDQRVKLRVLQARVANRAWNADQFRAVLETMIRAGVVWHEDGAVELADRKRGTVKRFHPLPNSSDLGFQKPQ